MTKVKKIAFVCISVVVLFAVSVLPTFANDLGSANELVATPASNIKSIVFVIDNAYEGLDDGERIEVDYWNLLRNSNEFSFAIEIPRGTVIIGDDRYSARYRISFSTTRYSGYAKNSLYVASRVNIDCFGDNQEDLSDKNRLLFSPAVKKIEIIYNVHTVHAYNTAFNRPYDGNIDATIGLTGEYEWESEIRYKTLAFNYYNYQNNNEKLAYYRLNNQNSLTSKRDTNSSVSNANYIPIGVRYAYGGVAKPIIRFYNGGSIIDVPGLEAYRYSIVKEATQTIEFTNTAYSGTFVITDMFTPSNASDIRLMQEEGVIESGQFEIGSFLRESVEGFLDLQIYKDFTLEALLWVIIGIGSVFALLFIFIGK